MDTTQLSTQIATKFLNGISVADFLAFFLVSLVALLINLLADENINFKFSRTWFQENVKRVLLSVLLIIVGLLGTKAIFGIELNWMIAVGMPFATDTILGFLMKNKKTN